MTWLREPDVEPITGYRLIEPLGSGGFGEVWKCEAPGGIFKAIKFVFGNLNSLDVDSARAEQELKALNRVKEVRHPFVLSMDRIEIVEGELLIVMELADKNLHDAYQEAKAAGLIGIPRDDLLRYLRDSAEALDYMCEKHGLQHLDIKPRNLFMVGDRVKVADFGLVKHLERSNASGILGGITPLYASPETFTGKISHYSDQYSLAIVYQELLTSHRPFQGKSARAVAQQQLTAEPDLRSLPEAERAIVARALSKEPEERFPNCLAFVRALYNARMPAQLPSESDVEEKSSNQTGARPRTIADTLEDFLLVGSDEPGLSSPRPTPIAGIDLDGCSKDEIVALGEEPALSELERLESAAWRLADDDGFSDRADVLSDLGVTACQPQTGTLRPTLILGVGGVGRRAMMEVRCRLLDRFGDLSRAPVFRFLYLESDGDAAKEAMRGAPEIVLDPGEIYHLSLQPISHYRRRQLDHLYEWLAREKLYSLPRSLKPQGSRALGRLAFSDHYLRLFTRLKRELREVTDPDVLYRSVSETGLALRDSIPRIIVVGSACGSSSGFFLDLGFSLRRLLDQLKIPQHQLMAFLHCGAPTDPATPAHETANLYATLTEWNHFGDELTSFTAQYGVDGPQLTEQGNAFDQTYLISQKQRSPEARREVVSHLGSYLFHELTTPVGHKLDEARAEQEYHSPFRSFGTHDVWFPRGLMLRIAGRQVVGRLLEHWAETPEERRPQFIHRNGDSDPFTGETSSTAEVDAACARILADSQLRYDRLAASLESYAAEHLNGKTPEQSLLELLQKLEEQCWEYGAPDDPGGWAEQTLGRVREWLGNGVSISSQDLVTGNGSGKSRLTRALEAGTEALAREQVENLAEAAFSQMGSPGARVTHAEATLSRLIQWCEEAAEEQAERRLQQKELTVQASQKLEEAMERCARGGGFGWLMGRGNRPLRVFIDHLGAFARQCVGEDTTAALEQFFQRLKGKLEDRLQDLGYCRGRLRQLSELLEIPPELLAANRSEDSQADLSTTSAPILSTEAFWEKLQCSPATRVVLPDGETNLEEAATRFVSTLSADHWAWIDQFLHDEVLETNGGLYRASMQARDAERDFLQPLIEHTARGLSQYLPITDVAQVELSLTEEHGGNLEEQLHQTMDGAAPLIEMWEGEVSEEEESEARPDLTYLLIPGSDLGKEYGEKARLILPRLKLVTVPGQAELMLLREKGNLSLDDLRCLLTPCRKAYQDAITVPGSSPHARVDIQDWIPLEP